jgi:hypothetical protein
MGDDRYGKLLLELMNESGHAQDKGLLLEAAARLAPTEALAVIQPLLKSEDPEERYTGVTALGAVELPMALPILLNMLSDASLRVRCAAATGLVSLTRQTPSASGLYSTGDDPADDISFWRAWVQTNSRAPIHPIRECPPLDDRITRQL